VAPPPDGWRDLTALLAPILSEYDVPALGGAIVTPDGVSALGVVGLRARGRPEAATPDDLFHLGSCTKAMTATLAGVLVQRGRIRWESTVGELLDDVPVLDPGWDEVTLEQLLAHEGGGPFNLVDYPGLGPAVWQREGDTPEQTRVLVEGLLAVPPAQPPGTQFVYSNDGYVIAGAMLARVAQASFPEAMRRLLFEPLGMTSAGFGPPGSAAAHDAPVGHLAGGQAVGYAAGNDNPGAYDPAGRVHATLADWGRFVALHLSRDGKEGLLDGATLKHLHEAHDTGTPPYAMGWQLLERPWGGGTVLHHNGTNTLWYCVAWLAPQRGFAVLAATNQGGDTAARACDAVAVALLGDLAAHPPAPPPGTPPGTGAPTR